MEKKDLISKIIEKELNPRRIYKYRSEMEIEEEKNEKEEDYVQKTELNVIMVAFKTKKEAEELIKTIDQFSDKSIIIKVNREAKEEIELKKPPNNILQKIKEEVHSKYKDLLIENDPIIRYVM